MKIDPYILGEIMGHNLEQLGTASLDTMGGLVTLADARDLPEGASPRCWDVDFLVGSVASRPGLSSVFAYATTLNITAYVLSYGIATFTYNGVEPTINEGFILNGFTGNQTYLNGLTVYVAAVSMTTFTALVGHADDGPVSNLTATAVSTTGLFVGPNLGSSATSTTWASPNNIYSSTGFASVSTGVSVSMGPTAPTTVTQSGSGSAWANPSNLAVTGASFATVTTSGSSESMLAVGTAFGVPANATITGITVSVNGNYVGSGTNTLSLQLATNGFPVGSPFNFALNSSVITYTKGSSLFQWGTTFTPATVNGSVLGLLVSGSVAGGSGTFSINNAIVTVYYTQAAVSGTLFDQAFGFSIGLSNGVSGFGASFIAYSSATTTVILQLLQNGIPVGIPKTQVLTQSKTVYSLGGSNDPWGYVWGASNVNSPTFGVQVTASGTGTTYIGDLDITPYITPALENFNWVGSFPQNNGSLATLALDAGGNLWKEDPINNPGVLSLALSGIIPGSFCKGAEMNNQEFLMFSDLSVGTDRPRLMDTLGNFYPVTQVGPGAPPTFQASTGTISGILSLTAYSQSGSTGTFTFTTVASPPSTNSLYVVSGTGTALDGQVLIVLSGATTSQITAKVTGTIANGSYTGTLTPQFSYAIASITQTPVYAHIASQLGFLLGPSPGRAGTGTCVTVWYNVYGFPADPALVAAMSNTSVPTFVYISNATTGSYNFNGIWQVTAVGQQYYPGTSSTGAYFCFTYTQSGSLGYTGIAGAHYQLTAATLTMATPIDSLAPGTQVTVTGATPSGWNNTWTISQSVNSGQYTISSTAYNYATNVATYTWQQAGTSASVPVSGNLIQISGCTNNAGFNGTYIIASVVGSTFTVSMNPALPAGIPAGSTVEGSAQAIMYGTVFTFDPGETFVGTNTNVIYGNDSGTGQIAIIGSSLVPIGAGTRQAICFFITKSGNWTPASPPITFTVATDANLLNVAQIPIGPSNVVGRGIAITEAGQNGVPGANFYVITAPVVSTIGTTTTTYTSTIINDNTSTTASFSFTDAVLLNSQEIDIEGFNLFNLIEIGSCGWCIPYASRMFYGLQLNKVQNFNNLSFDGGYQVPNQPAGWGLSLTSTTLNTPTSPELSLISSPVTDTAAYIINNTGSIQTVMGTMFQTAYQDSFKVAIINTNTAYSVRVGCSCPSGIRLGTLEIALVDQSNSVFGTSYGTFTIPLQSMPSTVSVFSGQLLAQSVFTGKVSPNLQLRVRVTNMGVNADCLIDRIEVYPTTFPYLKTEVYGSYINKPESVDASSNGGIIDTSTENNQACMGAFTLRDSLYLLKTNSLYVTKDNPNSEPSGWSLTEVSSRVGAVGINSYDSGDEWSIMACRSGIYGFTGAAPIRISMEIFQIWEAINWNAGNTIVLRNDNTNRRIYCAIPLPTGTSPAGVPTTSVQWLPYAPYNPAPTSPNVMLMLNYQSVSNIEELFTVSEMHTTMFGTLAVQDMKRKWAIWNITTPYMGRVIRPNYIDQPIFICNGLVNSKIYQLDPSRHDDDGAAIYSLYTTYGFVNAAKAVTMPIFGMHAKRYTVLQVTTEGNGLESLKIYPNTLSARYPYSVPVGITLSANAQDDFVRPVNVKGNRAFIEVSTNAVGSWFALHKILLTGKADAWSSLNPTGGGNQGIF